MFYSPCRVGEYGGRIPSMMIDFGRGLCADVEFAGTREWIVTNGIGGYAAGAVAGLLTRRYHGLLIAALQPPLGRTLLLTKLDETAEYDGRSYPLFANRWANDWVTPSGFIHLERFHLEGTTPIWTYACADALLDKRVWMQPGANTTYIRYDLRRAIHPLTLTIKVLVNYRDHHSNTSSRDWRMNVATVDHGLKVSAYDGAASFYILSSGGQATPQHDWYKDFYLSVEAYRGLNAFDDNLCAGKFLITLQPGDTFTMVASVEPNPMLDGKIAYRERQNYEQQLVAQNRLRDSHPAVRQLVLAADQFIVRRAAPGEPDGRTIIAGYPWFGDWGRDTMISLAGLTLVTGRPDIARLILRTFSHFVDQGMLPNRFPDAGETPEYNTVDATLWYFEAIRAYLAVTGDDDLLRELFPVLEEIMHWHQVGTRYKIKVDPVDGLLYSGEPGVQLTWMDVKIGDWVVTPRTGKAVEINALWYNALRNMSDFARTLGKSADDFDALAEQAYRGFGRFWNAETGYCFDVIDTPAGNDASLRPNQIFAVSLPHSPLDARQQRAVVDVCGTHLLTSHGLRSLAQNHPSYKARYGGNAFERDSAYHQGTVWGWLIGPFVTAHLRVYRDPEQALSYLTPLIEHLDGHAMGTISEIFDGDPPFTPRGCFAQAWSVAEVLRAWHAIVECKESMAAENLRKKQMS